MSRRERKYLVLSLNYLLGELKLFIQMKGKVKKMNKIKGMGNLLVKFMLVFILLMLPVVSVYGATTLKLVYDGKTVNYKNSTVKYTVNGKNIELNSTPGIILNNNSMGYYADVLKKGLKAECSYDSEKKKLTIKKFENTVELTLNSKTAYVNGKKKQMDVAMKKVKYSSAGVTRLMVPVRFVAENLGYSYTWVSSSKTGAIKYSWLELYNNGAWGKYTGSKVSTNYNGKAISYGNMPGMIIDGTCVIDANKVFKKTLGIDYTYNSTDKTVTLEKDNNTIVYTIGSKEAVVNGEKKNLSTPAIRIKNRVDSTYYIMVPAKFTATTFGYQYEWSSKTKTIQICDESYSGSIEAAAAASGASIYFNLPSGVEASKVKNADYYWKKKFIVTIPGDYVDYFKANPVIIKNSVVSKCSVSLTSEGKTKLTFTTTKLQGYKVYAENGVVWIKVGQPKDIYKNIVVLDCGHGGYDSGAIGGGYKEKDFTYSILYTYAKSYFNQSTSNVKAYWTRYNDTFVSLNDRAAYAKSIGADLFISLHMNSATSTSANGTEVFYSTSNNTTLSNGLNSKKMATYFEKNLTASLGMNSRGVKTANYVVIYKNTVPAILVELGFISNSSDRAKLADASFQKKSAKKMYQLTEDIFANYPTGR